MRVFIFGDANVDVTVKWRDVEANLDELSAENRKLLPDNIQASRRTKEDIEYYLPRRDEELSHFFNSLKPRVEFGGCGAIKARTMAMLGNEVVFYSWVGGDDNGKMILDELSKAGVDTSHVLVDGETCETFNLFDPDEERLAFSFWEPKLDLSIFIEEAKEGKASRVFLTGAHRIKAGLGYSRLPDAYVFTGSFAPYSKDELDRKYKADFSKGILVGNEIEMMQLSGESDPISGMKKLVNEIIVMHGPDKTAVKRGGELIAVDTEPVDRSRVKELTGLGDVWEGFFLSSVGELREASVEDVKRAMKLANKASVRRMMTGEFPTRVS